MNYLFLACAALCFAFQFVLGKVYQAKTGKTAIVVMLFNTGAGIISFLLFLALNRFRVAFNPFTVCMSLGAAAAMTANNFVAIRAMSCGKISVYTLFNALGGMLIPFVYGLLFLNEEANVFRYISLVLLIVSMVVPCFVKSGEKSKKTFYILCLLAFICNGTANTVLKEHQVNALASTDFSFLIWSYFFIFAINGLVLTCWYTVLALRAKKQNTTALRGENGREEGTADAATAERNGDAAEVAPVGEKEAAAAKSGKKQTVLTACLTMALYGLVNGAGNLCQMKGAATLPAVLMYPVMTGGVIILTAIFGRLFFKEKITKYIAISIGIAFAATLLFLF